MIIRAIIIVVFFCTTLQKNACGENVDITDYFPIRAGIKLCYEIEMGYVEPLAYQEAVWHKNNISIATSTRREFEAVGTDVPKKIFLLELETKEPEKIPGQINLPTRVEVVVKKDELDIYKNAKQIFWSIDSGNLVCKETVIYFPNRAIAPKGMDKNGISERVLLFCGKAGTKIGRSGNFKNSHDTLLFSGIENAPESNTPALHFVRRVKVGFADADKTKKFTLSIDKEFEEHSFFVKGKGLVYLEQIIEKNISMIWRLIDQKK